MPEISFNTIPANILTPGVYIEIDGSKAFRGLPVPRRRAVIIGQRLASGTAAINTLVRVDSADLGKQLAGAGSILANMIARYKANDSSSELWMVAVNDLVSGSKASWTFTVSTQPTANGTLPLYIGGKSYPVAVQSGASVASIATAIAAAINADLDLPATATSALGVVSITFAHKGAIGNGLDIRVGYDPQDAVPAGVTYAIAVANAGTGVPDITAAITAIGDQPFASIVHAFSDATNLTTLENWLLTRFGGMYQNDGLAYTASVDVVGNLETLGQSRNSPFTVIGGIRALPSPSWELAAATAAQAHQSTSNDPAQPLTGLVLVGIKAPAPADRMTRQEREYCLEDGIGTYTIDDAGNVCIERLVTTDTLNSLGFPDPTYRDVTTMTTLAYLRWSRRYMIATTFQRYKLGNDGTNYGAGQKVATPKTIKAAIVTQYKAWIEAALIEDDLPTYKTSLVVQRSTTDLNTVLTIDSPNIINQFLVLASQIQFVL
jgi:phage tail sheath gpL-like